MKDITPNQVLGDVMTQETYRVEREGVDKDVKKEDEDKKKSVAIKVAHHPRATTSPRKKKQVMMKMLVKLMIKPCLSLCARWANS